MRIFFEAYRFIKKIRVVINKEDKSVMNDKCDERQVRAQGNMTKPLNSYIP